MTTGEKIREVMPYLDDAQCRKVLEQVSYQFDARKPDYQGETPYYFDLYYPQAYKDAGFGNDRAYYRIMSPQHYSAIIDIEMNATVHIGDESNLWLPDDKKIKPGTEVVLAWVK